MTLTRIKKKLNKKVPQTGWLKTIEIYCLAVLEARSLKLRYPPHGASSETLGRILLCLFLASGSPKHFLAWNCMSAVCLCHHLFSVGVCFCVQIYKDSSCIGASFGAQAVKNLPAMQEIWVRSLGQEDPLEEEIATHSSILAWRIPWTEEPGGLPSMGWQRVIYNWAANTFTFHFQLYWIRDYLKWSHFNLDGGLDLHQDPISK